MAVTVLLVEQIGNEIEVTIESENAEGLAAPNPTTQKERRGSSSPRGGVKMRRKDYYLQQREARELPTRVHAELMGPHIPIILLELPGAHEDKIVWKCAQRFVVQLDMDPGYAPVNTPPGAEPPPVCPLKDTVTGEAWSHPQTSQAGAGPYAGFQVVQATYRKATRAKEHLFYKCTIWCNGLKYDPDFYCDEGP